MKIVEGRGKRVLKGMVVSSAVAGIVLIMTAASLWASGGGGEHGGGHAVGWQATDWYRVMNFAVLAIGLFLVLKKPVAQALGGRIQGISQELEELESKKAAAEKQLAECNAKLARLDGEADKILSDYIRQGEEAKARILREAEASAEKLKEHARKNIEHQFEQAKLALQQQVVDKALTQAEKIIKKTISADDQRRLVDEYLEKVVA